MKGFRGIVKAKTTSRLSWGGFPRSFTRALQGARVDPFSRLRRELSWCKSLALQMLKGRYSDAQIKVFVNRLLTDDNLDMGEVRDDLYSKGLESLDFPAVNAVFNFEVLQDFFSGREENYRPDDVCEVVLLALTAGMSLHNAGVYPAVKHSEKFRESCRLPRQDVLGRVLDGVFKDHLGRHGKPPQYMQVVHSLKEMAKNGHAVIQEVDTDEGVIYWRRGSGAETKTSFKRLQERLSGVRKKYSGLSG